MNSKSPMEQDSNETKVDLRWLAVAMICAFAGSAVVIYGGDPHPSACRVRAPA